MKAVYLNHMQFIPARFASWLMLLIGLVALGLVFIQMQNFKRENAALQARLDVLYSKVVLPRVSLSKAPDAQAEAAKAAIGQIMLPWASLLKGLEAANQDSVKMLALEPNPKTRTIKLSLVALDQASMWAYLESLKQQNILQQVKLVSNESVEVNGAQALAFSVEAKWQG